MLDHHGWVHRVGHLVHKQGIWGFNEAHLTVWALGTSCGRVAVFITVPYACVFTYACFKKYIPKSPLASGIER